MARAVLLAVLVLCAAAVMAHAGRIIQEVERESDGVEGASWLKAPAEAPSPYAGGLKLRGRGGSTGGYGDVVANALWFVFKWANDAYAAAARRKVQ